MNPTFQLFINAIGGLLVSIIRFFLAYSIQGSKSQKLSVAFLSI